MLDVNEPKRGQIFADKSGKKFVALRVVEEDGVRLVEHEEYNMKYEGKPTPLKISPEVFNETMVFHREMEDGERARYFNAGDSY